MNGGGEFCDRRDLVRSGGGEEWKGRIVEYL